MALGARAADVQRMVVLGGMRLAGLGVVIGLLLAAGASRLLVTFLYGVSPLDAPTFFATSLLFVAESEFGGSARGVARRVTPGTQSRGV